MVVVHSKHYAAPTTQHAGTFGLVEVPYQFNSAQSTHNHRCWIHHPSKSFSSPHTSHIADGRAHSLMWYETCRYTLQSHFTPNTPGTPDTDQIAGCRLFKWYQIAWNWLPHRRLYNRLIQSIICRQHLKRCNLHTIRYGTRCGRKYGMLSLGMHMYRQLKIYPCYHQLSKNIPLPATVWLYNLRSTASSQAPPSSPHTAQHACQLPFPQTWCQIPTRSWTHGVACKLMTQQHTPILMYDPSYTVVMAGLGGKPVGARCEP